MSTYPLGTAPRDDAAPPERSRLSPRAWLLLPLVLIGAFGVVVPLWRVEAAPRLREPPPPVERVPYSGALEPLLERSDLEEAEFDLILDLHQRLERQQRQHGGVPREEAERVERLLERYR